MKEKTIKIYGHTQGDDSVGIGQTEIEIDTGLYEITEEDRKWINETIMKNIWELHDNGPLRYWYSDKPDTEKYVWILDSQFTKEIIKSHTRKETRG